MLNAQQVGERLAELRAKATVRQDALLVDFVDFIRDLTLEPVPAVSEVLPAEVPPEPKQPEPVTAKLKSRKPKPKGQPLVKSRSR